MNIGIKKRGVHLLRRIFGKKMVQKNVNLSTIKELMGHENIQTTMIYARSDEGSMIQAVLTTDKVSALNYKLELSLFFRFTCKRKRSRATKQNYQCP